MVFYWTRIRGGMPGNTVKEKGSFYWDSIKPLKMRQWPLLPRRRSRKALCTPALFYCGACNLRTLALFYCCAGVKKVPFLLGWP